MALRIRLLEADDSMEELTVLLHAAYRRMGEAGFNLTAVDQTVETTRERCIGGTCFIAEFEGKMAGTIKLNPPDLASLALEFHEEGVGIINQFAVHPDFAGAKVGFELHKRAVDEAKRIGYKALLLDTVDGAHSLVRLYESWGYRIVGRIHWPGKTYDSYIMRLDHG